VFIAADGVYRRVNVRHLLCQRAKEYKLQSDASASASSIPTYASPAIPADSNASAAPKTPYSSVEGLIAVMVGHATAHEKISFEPGRTVLTGICNARRERLTPQRLAGINANMDKLERMLVEQDSAREEEKSLLLKNIRKAASIHGDSPENDPQWQDTFMKNLQTELGTRDLSGTMSFSPRT
jgi:hypothetical protein